MVTGRKLLLALVFLLLIVAVGAFSFTDGADSLFRARERQSPGNWIQEEQIKVYREQVILDVPGAQWAGFTDTNSMDPLLDEDAHALELKPSSPDAIQVGDVISYQSPYGVLVHRVVEKDADEEGAYFIVKGDNSTIRDPFKVRFEQVEGVVVAVIY